MKVALLRSALLTAAIVMPAGIAAAASCPVTQPAAPLFAPPVAYIAQPDARAAALPVPHATAFYYGTPQLWTQLQASGTLGRRDKLFWWSPGYNGAIEPRPNLTITIRPFDSRITMSPEARPTNAFFGGAWSMLTMIEFPEAGCWEVTGRYRDRNLTFVTMVP